MASCEKRTLQPGGGTNPSEELPCKETLLPGGGPAVDNDFDDPFEPGVPPEAGSCNVDSDCPEGYFCVDGICVPASELPGGPNTPILEGGTGIGGGAGEGGNEGGEPGGSSGHICVIPTPIPNPDLGNPKDQVPGGDTLRIDGEGSSNATPSKKCDEAPNDNESGGPGGGPSSDGGGPGRGGGCCDVEEEDKNENEFCELKVKDYDENGWEVTDRSQEPYETGYPEPFSGTLGRGKEEMDHSINCQAQNGQELWNLNDGISHKDCFLPDKYDAIKWEPRGFIFCRRVDMAHDLQVWRDEFIGDLRKYQKGAAEGETPEELEDVSGMTSARRGGSRIPRGEQTSGRLFVEHATTLYDCLSVKEWAYFNDTVTVREATTLYDNLFVRTDAALYDTLYVRQKALMEESLIVKEHIFSEGKLTVAGRARVDLLISEQPHIYIGGTCWTFGTYDVIDPKTFRISFNSKSYTADTIKLPVLIPYEDPDYGGKIQRGELFLDDPYCGDFCEREIIVQPSASSSRVGGSTYVFTVTLPECDDDQGSEQLYEYEFISSIGFAAYRAVVVTAAGDASLSGVGKRGTVVASRPGTFTMTIQVTHGERMKLVGTEEVHLVLTNPLSGNQDNAKA